MVILKGKSIFEGIAIGRLLFYKRHENNVGGHRVQEPQQELCRFETARQTALSQLEALYHMAFEEIGKENAMIFEIQKVMLNDEVYCDSIRNIIVRRKMNAEYAISKTAEKLYHVFEKLSDEYLQGRSSDVRDVSVRLLNILSHSDAALLCGEEPVIVAADDLVPSETVRLDRSKVLGFVTIRGTVYSHTAILARTMGIPAVIHAGEGLLPEYDGHMAVVDGFNGQIYVDPEEQLLEDMKLRQQVVLREDKEFMRYRGMENISVDGRRIHIYANIGRLSDVESVVRYDAGGVGLFRSEFLFMERPQLPTEEEQFDIYREAALRIAPRPMIVRLLDVSSDKQLPAARMPAAKSRTSVSRGIRFCLERLDVLRPQLRALCRAAGVCGNLSVLIPMIVAVEEVQQVKALLAEITDDLRAKGLPFSEKILLGAMIETPAAVIISDLLAKEADFFSIGTNDLTQYTLAADRSDSSVNPPYDAQHPALLRMIKMTVENAHAHGIPVGICGQMAADLSLTDTFLDMGVDSLSVPPPMVLPLRKRVLEAGSFPLSDGISDRNIG